VAVPAGRDFDYFQGSLTESTRWESVA
jgi:hypothetical protein